MAMLKKSRSAQEVVLQISKYSATGNTFVVIDIREVTFSREKIPGLCSQYKCDGILLLENSDNADFKMNYYNADGSFAEMCGNGGRAITLFASHLGISPSANMKYDFVTSNGRYQAELLPNEVVKLRMTELYDIDLYDLSLFGFPQSFYLNTGVPHAVFEVDHLEQFDVVTNGRQIAHHKVFPNGSNVNFYQTISDGKLKIRTYERGVEDETLSCGTGATATAIAVSKHYGWTGSVNLITSGGELEVLFDSDYTDIFLCGKVEKIFSKQLDLG